MLTAVLARSHRLRTVAHKSPYLWHFRFLRTLFQPYKRRLAGAALGVSFVGFCMAASPLFLKVVMDKALPDRDISLALLVVGAFVLLMLVRMAAWYAAQCVVLMVREQVVFDLRSQVFAHLQELSLSFHSRVGAGFLLDRTLGGASVAVGNFLCLLFYPVIACGATVLFSLIFCFGMDWRLAGLAFSLGLLNAVIGQRSGKRIHRVTKEYNLQANQMSGKVSDLLHGIKTVKAFAREANVSHEFSEKLWPLQLKSRDVTLETILLQFYSEGLGYFIHAAVLAYGSWLVLEGDLSFGALVAFIGFQGLILGMMAILATVGGSFGGAVAGLDQVREILETAPAVPHNEDARMPAIIAGYISLKDVTFGYDERPVLQEVNLQVLPGESVALVGPSGGGKSTLAGLLLRLHDPDCGSIELDGVNIKDLPLAGYRKLFGAVLQDTFVFNDTVYNNLVWANPGATEAEVQVALQRAQAWEFVNQLEGGWHYNCGQSGANLSGGQRQRLAIARCFLTDPRFLILDEATSALDNQSEALVQQALAEIMRGRTVFIIAHRLSTIRHADRILVFERGRVVQEGTYDELSQTQGTFQELLNANHN